MDLTNKLFILPQASSDGERICLQCRRPRFDPWIRKILQRREWLPAPSILGASLVAWMVNNLPAMQETQV